MLHDLISIWFGWVHDWGYWGVFLLMALESTIIPIPSELVLPPAAFWAAQGQMNFYGVVAAGTLGSYFGSSLSYWFFRLVGTSFIRKYAAKLMLTPEKLELAERWVNQFGAPGVLIARFLPVIRHLISIPAGVFKMRFSLFSLVTTAGAGIWCFILSWWGEKIIGRHPDLLNSPAEMMAAIRSEMSTFIITAFSFAFLYLLFILAKNRLIKKN